MTSVETTTGRRFVAPSSETWEQDPVHFPRPVSRYFEELHPEAFAAGFDDFLRYYGLPFGLPKAAAINRIYYGARRRDLDGDERRQRLARAAEVFEQRLWREQLREWDERVKPKSMRAHLALQAVDPASLGEAELVEYIGRCRAHHAAMIRQHMAYTGTALFPVGDFLAHAGEWTGLPPAELLSLLRGTAPVSAGASAQLDALVAALRRDDEARATVESGARGEDVLEALRSKGGETADALAAYLELVGYRLVDGFDITNPYLLELPDSLVRAIRLALVAQEDEDDGLEARTAAARERAPEALREQFDDLLAEARLTYRLRDERGVFSDIWAAGLARRAVLAGGERVAANGLVEHPEHFVEAGWNEMQSLLRRGEGPAAAELAARFDYRCSHSAREAPPRLGPPPPPPPDPATLPPAAARVVRAFLTTSALHFGSSEAPHEVGLVRGLGASPGVFEGPARCVTSPEDFDLIDEGDVLVTTSTTEAFNILLPLLGAMVTDSGGLLSHAAIVAREYGIPAVVGTRDGTTTIVSGTRVRVDGTAGEVALLG